MRFSLDHYNTMRANCTELSWAELNMAVSGQLRVQTSDPELSHSYHAKEWEKYTTAYHHHGCRVCRNTFLFLHGVGSCCLKAIKFHCRVHRNTFLFQHGVGSCHLKAIKFHYLANGLVPRRHANTGRVHSNALSLDVQHVHFILHYAEANAIYLGVFQAIRGMVSSCFLAVPRGKVCGWSIRRWQWNSFIRWQPTPPFASCGKISHRL